MVYGVENMISDETLDKVWGSANFGDAPKRDVVKYSLLKYASVYKTGHTAFCILLDLGLVNEKEEITKFGKEYLYEAFSEGNSY